MRRPVLGLVAAAFAFLAMTGQASATFAGIPGKIAFSVNVRDVDPSPREDGQGAIWTVNPDGTGLTQISAPTSEPDDDSDPSWSPDGSLIAFQSTFPYTQATPYPARPESEVDLMNADGSGRRTVTGGQVPFFSPDGQRIYSFTSDIDLLTSRWGSTRLDGTEYRVEPRDSLPSGPNVSTDGRYRLQSVEGDIYVTGSGARLTNTPGIDEYDPVWAPDMSAIAYVAVIPPGDRWRFEIFVKDLASGKVTRVSNPAVEAFGPDWGANPVSCGGLRATIVGTPGSDELFGTGAADVIAGLGGADRIAGGGGADVICGGDADDRLIGNQQNDRLFGKAGRDFLAGNKGKDRLVGGADRDRCAGGKGKDRAKACEKKKGL